MPIVKLEKDGFGQIELNQVAWSRDGRIEAQCYLDEVEFETEKAENGTLFAVDSVTRALKKATTTLAAVMPVGVNYSAEHMYDERTLGLKHFALGRGEILPRVGYPSIGDKFTTNNIAYDTADFADIEALEDGLKDIANTPLYAGINDDMPGILTISTDIPTVGPAFRVVEKTTMPDGQLAVKLHGIRA